MKEITEKKCIDLIKETFPDFISYWENYIQEHGPDDGITIQMMPFEDYTIDVIKSNNTIEIIKIFNLVEFIICHGNESVQNAITTSYLEYLMSKDPEEIQFIHFAKYLGKNCREYCKAWDEFTGVRTKGLWEEE